MGGELSGDLAGAARSRVDGMATLHVLALVSVVALAALHVLDGPAVMAGLGMILHGFREAHRSRPAAPPSDPDESASDHASAPPPAPPPAPKSQRRRTSGGLFGGLLAGARRLSWVGVVLAAAGLASCATMPPTHSNAPDLVLKTRAAIRQVCAVATRAADEVVKLFDDPASGATHDTGADASAQSDAAADAAEVTP